MDTLRRSMYDWCARKAASVHASIWLGALSFTESSVFVIPPDPLLAALVFLRRERWLRYALFTAGWSVAGAAFGYVVGAVLFETIGVRIVAWYDLQEYMTQAIEVLNESVFIFTLTAAFTPIPFKVAVLAAGFAKANIAAFFVATLIGRSARYLLIAFVAKVFGDHAEAIMKRFWFYATLSGVGVLVLYGVYLLVA